MLFFEECPQNNEGGRPRGANAAVALDRRQDKHQDNSFWKVRTEPHTDRFDSQRPGTRPPGPRDSHYNDDHQSRPSRRSRESSSEHVSNRDKRRRLDND